MYQKILIDSQKNHLFEKHKKVLIAVSGGVDSMNLLHFLHLYKDIFKIEIGIAHVNHKQRIESDDEEKYLRDWSKQHSIPFFSTEFSGNFSETVAREFRYSFFKEIMSTDHYTALVTAHHKDDQVETILMRVIRGSLLRYLGGIKRVNKFGDGELIRPFLPFSKSELPSIFHFEDSSNQQEHYQRNRIRKIYLPLLRKENKRFDQQLLALAEESQLYTQAILDLTKDITITDLSQFLAQSSAVRQILFQNYLALFSELNVSKAQFLEMFTLLQKDKQVRYLIKNGYYLLKDNKQFEIKKISPKTDSKESLQVLEYDNQLDYQSYHFSFNTSTEQLSNSIPLYSEKPIILRHRKPGDRIRFGQFSKKIRRLFIDDKLSLEDRETAIIGQQNEEIIFVLTKHKTYLRKALENDIIKARLYVQKIKKG